MGKKFVALVVEDDPMQQLIAKAEIEPHAEVLIAGSLKTAMRILRTRQDLTHIILDGLVPRYDNEPIRGGDTTLELFFDIIELHPGVKTYSASSDEDLNDELVQAGCIRAEKKTAPGMVCEDISMQQIAP